MLGLGQDFGVPICPRILQSHLFRIKNARTNAKGRVRRIGLTTGGKNGKSKVEANEGNKMNACHWDHEAAIVGLHSNPLRMHAKRVCFLVLGSFAGGGGTNRGNNSI